MATTMDTTAPAGPPDERPDEDVVGTGATQVSTRRYVRSPESVLRLVVYAVVTLVLLALTIWVEDSILGLETDIISLFSFLTPTMARILNGTLEVLVAIVSIIVYLVPLFTRRYRVFGYLMLAASSAFVLMTLANELVTRNVPEVLTNQLVEGAGVDRDVASSVVGLAQLSAVFTVVSPFVGRRWRRAGMVIILVVVIGRLLVAAQLPADVFLAIPLGATCGTAVLLAFGRPDRRPTLAAIRAALADAGIPVSEVHPASVDARGSTPYFATLQDGGGLFVKILGEQERAADLLFRSYRFLRLKDVGDGRPFSSLRRTIEHEALVALLARDVGVETPRLRGVVEVGADSMLLAYDMIDGVSLDALDDERITDELMRGIWQQVAIMRRHRIAHRDLRSANVFVAGTGEPWMIDFGFSEAAASDDLLAADVAQLLASLATRVGPQRAVDAAIGVLGRSAVGDALPRLQMKALSGATQSAMKAHKGLLGELQTEVIERCGVEEVHYAELDRINRKTIITIAALALATYFLLPQLADLPGIVDQIEEANWAWAPLVVLTSIGTYLAAAMALAGAIPQRLPAGPLVAESVGSSFASKLAPAGLGGMALQVRFLQKQGVDEPVAVSGVGLNTLAGVVGHVTLIGVFLVWAGREAFGDVSLPNPIWLLLAIGVTLAAVGIAMLIPPIRRLVASRLWPIVSRGLQGIGTVLTSPTKLVLLLGGSILITFSYLTTLYFSTQAFGGGLPFAAVGAVFLIGSMIAQVAPTPGGLGAVEAALIGGLVAAGMENSIAVPAVFLYRLVTFWLPVIPGWFCFQWLQRHDYL